MGECSLANFEGAYNGSNGDLASALGMVSITEDELKAKCAAALTTNQIDLVDVVGQGPQFLKNFFDGGTDWNDHSTRPASTDFLATVDASSHVFSAPNGGADDKYPGYFSNFQNAGQECRLGMIECCYTTKRSGTAPTMNAEMCAHDMTLSAQSNHIHMTSWAVYDAPEKQAYCSGFAYENGSFGDTVKYNTLFHMAMKTNLRQHDLVQEIPGAPMCGCVEQMPIVATTHADCVEAKEGYKIVNGSIQLNIAYQGCGDLKTYYNNLEGRTHLEKFFVDTKLPSDSDCTKATASFLNDKFLVPSTSA
jgi:hypothetical protein